MDSVFADLPSHEVRKIDDGACNVGTPLAACLWIYTKTVEIDGEASHGVRRKRELMDNTTTRLCVRVVAKPWVSEYTMEIREKKILKLIEHDLEIPVVWSWSLLWFSATTEQNNIPKNARTSSNNLVR